MDPLTRPGQGQNDRPATMRRKARAARLQAHRRKIGAPLTDREVEVMWLVSEGLSNKEIAAILDMSAHTAKFHVENCVLKLDANTRTRAAVNFVLARADEAPAHLNVSSAQLRKAP